MTHPKVFISYSWSPTSNKIWVGELAERMVSNSINVIIDLWSTSEGQDKFKFMEQMVNDPEVEKVLIICNKDYTLKANDNKGGVGIESQIISKEIYENVDQKKFIPIVREFDGEKPFLPIFVSNRFYIDMSTEDKFEDGYEQLMRNIYNQPRFRKPPFGPPPAYITDDDPIYLRTTNTIRTIKNSLDNNRPDIQRHIQNYYEEFILALKDREVTLEFFASKVFDEEMLHQIELAIPLRDNLLDFLKVMIPVSTYFSIDNYHTFLENILAYQFGKDFFQHPVNSAGFLKEDYFHFIIYELFLYSSAFFLKKEEFKALGLILQSPFIIDFRTTNQFLPTSYSLFSSASYGINEIRNRRLGLNRINITADLIKQRANNPSLSFEELKEADLILYYASLFHPIDDSPFGKLKYWFPHTSIYGTPVLKIIQKMISKRYFEKIKHLFGVQDASELNEKINQINDEAMLYKFAEYRIPDLKSVFKNISIGKYN